MCSTAWTSPIRLTTPRPQMIPVKNLPASTIVEVLKTVYKSQLTARTGVRPMTIPQGLSFEMTSMLQLINAAAEAPLLTLDIDLTTNSIVMRAPRQLGEEIEEFVTRTRRASEGRRQTQHQFGPAQEHEFETSARRAAHADARRTHAEAPIDPQAGFVD